MNFFIKNKWTIIIIAVLVAVNIATIFTLWFHHYSSKECDTSGCQMPHEEVVHFCQKHLDLSEKQLKQFSQLREEYFNKSNTILVSMKNIRQDMVDEFSSEHPDKDKLKRLADEVGMKHAELKKESIKHFFEVMNILNNEQQKKFSGLFSKMSIKEQMHHPRE